MYLWNEFSGLILTYRAWINPQVVSKWPLCDTLYTFSHPTRCWSHYFLCPSFLLSPPCVYLFLPSTPFSSMSFPECTLPLVHVSVSRTCAKRSLAMRLVRGGGRRISSSSSWPRCCLCPGPSPASWTRPRSSGWPSATCTCAPLLARGTHPGALWWRGTATAAKVSLWECQKLSSLCYHFPPVSLLFLLVAVRLCRRSIKPQDPCKCFAQVDAFSESVSVWTHS